MIIVNLKGGLGNQMFQYAMGKALAIKYAQPLKLDITGYRPRNYQPGDTVRAFGLSHFSIKADIASDEEVRAAKYPFGILSKALRFARAKVFRVYHTDYHPEIFSKVSSATKYFYLDGFFQSELYFKDIREYIVKDFSMAEALTPELENAANQIRAEKGSVALHIRRGDYVSDAKTNQAHGVCSIEYYQKAAEYLAEKIKAAGDTPTFFIFSDDIAWVKENLNLPYPMVYSSALGLKDYQELFLMMLCRHDIIANSSFSWWGAWLNQNPEKIVVAPQKWTNAVPDDHPNIIPSTWLRM